MDGIQLPWRVVPTVRHADSEISPGGRVGTWEVPQRGSREEEIHSEAKFNLKHKLVPRFAH